MNKKHKFSILMLNHENLRFPCVRLCSCQSGVGVGGSLWEGKVFGAGELWCVVGPSLIQTSRGSVVRKTKEIRDASLTLQREARKASASHTVEASRSNN